MTVFQWSLGGSSRANSTSRPSGESRGQKSMPSGSPTSRWSEPSAFMRQSCSLRSRVTMQSLIGHSRSIAATSAPCTWE